MIQCPTCQTLNKEPSRFCLECGTRFNPLEAKESSKNPPDSSKVARSPRLRSPLLSGELEEEPQENLSSKSGNKSSANLTQPKRFKTPSNINNIIPTKESLAPTTKGLASEFTTVKSNVIPPKLHSPLLSGDNEAGFSSTFTRIPLPSSFSPDSEKPGHHLRSPLLDNLPSRNPFQSEAKSFTSNPYASEKPGHRLHSPLLDNLPSKKHIQFESETVTSDPYADEDNPNILRSPLLSEKMPLDNAAILKPKQTRGLESPQVAGTGNTIWSSPLDNKPTPLPESYSGSNSLNSQTNNSSILAGLGVTIPATTQMPSATASALDYLIASQSNIPEEQIVENTLFTKPKVISNKSNLENQREALNQSSTVYPSETESILSEPTSPLPAISTANPPVLSEKSMQVGNTSNLNTPSNQVKETDFFSESTQKAPIDRPNSLSSSPLINSTPEIKTLKTKPLSRSSFSSAQANEAGSIAPSTSHETLPSSPSNNSLLLKICGVLVLCMACGKLITLLQLISTSGSPSFIFDAVTTLIAFIVIGIGFLLSRK